MNSVSIMTLDSINSVCTFVSTYDSNKFIIQAIKVAELLLMADLRQPMVPASILNTQPY